MRTAWILTLVLALSACTATDPTDDDAGIDRDGGPTRDAGFAVSSTRAFSLMTWNIEFFPKTASTASNVREILADLQPDLVGVQEIRDPPSFERLVASLPDYEGTVVHEEFLAVGMLYRPNRVRVANIQTLFEDDDYAFPRAPLRVDVDVIGPSGETRFDFVFIVVHLKAQGDARSQYRRMEALQKLDVYIRERQASEEEQDYIIIGDYNDRLTDEAGNNVFRPMLDSPDRYTFLTLTLEQQGQASYIPIPGFIDHILITNDALSEYGAGRTEAIRIEEVHPNYVGLVSDHRPVRALFALP